MQLSEGGGLSTHHETLANTNRAVSQRRPSASRGLQRTRRRRRPGRHAHAWGCGSPAPAGRPPLPAGEEEAPLGRGLLGRKAARRPRPGQRRGAPNQCSCSRLGRRGATLNSARKCERRAAAIDRNGAGRCSQMPPHGRPASSGGRVAAGPPAPAAGARLLRRPIAVNDGGDAAAWAGEAVLVARGSRNTRAARRGATWAGQVGDGVVCRPDRTMARPVLPRARVVRGTSGPTMQTVMWSRKPTPGHGLGSIRGWRFAWGFRIVRQKQCSSKGNIPQGIAHRWQTVLVVFLIVSRHKTYG